MSGRGEKDIIILRELAKQYAEIASHPEQDEKRNLWFKLNRAERVRPMFMVDEIPWHEMEVEGELTLRCQEPINQMFETNLRRKLYKCKYIKDDFVDDPMIYVPKKVSGLGHIGFEVHEKTIPQAKGINAIKAHEYEPWVNCADDIEKIHVPEIVVDEAENAKREEMANEAFAGILDVIMDGPDFHYAPWDRIMEIGNFEEIIIAMHEDPDFVHALMEKMVQVYEGILRQFEEKDLLMRQRQLVHCTGAWTNELAAQDKNPKNVRAKDCWTYGMAQILYMVSPAMQKEFEFDYAPRWYANFGLGYYGCCEPLEDRLEYVKQLPNIRKISSSAWVNSYEKFAEQLEGRFVCSYKPSPACMVDNVWDPDAVKRELLEKKTIAEKYGCACEFTLKDISGVCGHPERVWQWAQIMRDVACG